MHPLGEQMVGRHPKGDRRVADLSLRANEALRHRRERHDEGSRDLLGGEPPQRAKREGHLRLGSERRVAAGEHELQPVVLDRAHRRGSGRPIGALVQTRHAFQLPPLVVHASLTPEPIDRLVPRGGGDPRARVVRQARPRPALQRDGEGLLHGLLGHVEVAQHPDEGRDRPPRLLTEQAVRDRRGVGAPYGAPGSGTSITGRTSIVPSLELGILAAASIASSRLSHSTR